MSIANYFKNIFKKEEVVFPKNSSWMLNDDLSINKQNIKRCKEFIALKNTKQSKFWHKEGDALNHTFLVCEKMNKIITTGTLKFSDYDKKVLMVAALCHDLGKATTTYLDEKDNDWHCKNHGFEGEKITRNLLFDEDDYWFREEVCWLVRHHMIFHHLLDKSLDTQKNEILKLSRGLSTIEKLLWLNISDSLGSKSKENTFDRIKENAKKIQDLAIKCNCYNKTNNHNFKITNEFKVFILIGPPGCGKDTYINKFLRGYRSISRDDIREQLTDGNIEGRKIYFDNQKEKKVTDIVNSNIKDFCLRKESFIINQTNMKRKYREELVDEILKYANPKIIYIYIEAPSIDECKKRRGNGKWDAIVDRMWNNFEFPDYNECDNIIFYKQKK